MGQKISCSASSATASSGFALVYGQKCQHGLCCCARINGFLFPFGPERNIFAFVFDWMWIERFWLYDSTRQESSQENGSFCVFGASHLDQPEFSVSGITEGPIFRSIKMGQVWGNGMTAKVLWQVVRDAASSAGIEKLAPHGAF